MQQGVGHTQSELRDGVLVSGDLGRLWLESVLMALPPEVLETALVCAIPAWFDLRLMVLLTGLDELSAATHLIQLVAAQVIQPAGDGGYVYHQAVRQYLLKIWPTYTHWRRYIALIDILAQHYLPLVYEQAARLSGVERASALAMLDRLYPNLEALWQSAVLMGYKRLIYKLVAVMDSYHTRRELWPQKVAWLESGLTACDRLEHEALRAEMFNSLGVAYMRLPDGDTVGRVQKAITCYRQALNYFTPKSFPVDYAMVQNNLGNAYMHIGASSKEYLPRAIACYEEALRYCCLESAPLSYAIICSNLAYAYSELTTGPRDKNLRHAITHYQEALRVYTLDRTPAAYARIQVNLGAIHAMLSSDGDRDPQSQEFHLRAMIVCYEASLKFYTYETAPTEFARIQIDLARAHTLLSRRVHSEHTRRAIEHYRAALCVYTLEATPQRYAEIWVALGLSYSQLPGGPARTSTAKHLWQAIGCYREALRVYSLATAPEAYAQVQIYMGIAYAGLSVDDCANDLQQAWLSYHAAARGMAAEPLSSAYAQLHAYLGHVYEQLATLDSHANLLQAIACYEASLTVFTPETAPQANAHIHNKLDALYAQLPSPRRSPAEVASAR